MKFDESRKPNLDPTSELDPTSTPTSTPSRLDLDLPHLPLARDRLAPAASRSLEALTSRSVMHETVAVTPNDPNVRHRPLQRTVPDAFARRLLPEEFAAAMVAGQAAPSSVVASGLPGLAVAKVASMTEVMYEHCGGGAQRENE